MENFSRDKHIQTICYLDKIEHNHNIPPIVHRPFYMDANLINVDFDTPIYRIFHWNRFMDLLTNKRLCLVKPAMWDDPFENFLLKSQCLTKSGLIASFDGIREQLYGLCWTLKEECDGLWRNYTNYSCKECGLCDWKKRHGDTNVSVKVKTTVGKLMSAFYDMENVFHSLTYWIGKVDYVADADIMNILSDGFDRATDSTCVNLVRTLLVKRTAFEYEREVRMIFVKPENADADFSKVKNKWNNSDLFFVNIEPNLLIDEIEFDPWILPSILSEKEKEISSLYTGAIKKSSLYNEPFFTVKE